MKDEFLKMMALKQRQIMEKFGLDSKSEIDSSTMPVIGDFNMLNSLTLQTPDGPKTNIIDRIKEVTLKQNI